MTNEEIKSECEINYAKIIKAEKRLSELRGICKHDHTFVGNYSFRVGNIVTADICSYCNYCVRVH